MTPKQSYDERKAKISECLPALQGKDLACWCKIGVPCHADILLELANRLSQSGDGNG